MDSKEKILYAVVILGMLSLPIYFTIHLYNLEVIPNLVRFGWTIKTVDQLVFIVIFSFIAGLVVEGFILAIIEYLLNNM